MQYDRAEQHLETLKKAIMSLPDAEWFSEPKVMDNGRGEPMLAWDGPSEWAATIGSGASIYAGATGKWGSSKTEPELAAAIEKVYNDGCFFEAINSCQLAVCE